MTGFEMASAVMAVLDERSEGSESGLSLPPHVRTTDTYSHVVVGEHTVWDDEDDNSGDEWTLERELAHAEQNIRDLVAALTAMLPQEPAE